MNYDLCNPTMAEATATLSAPYHIHAHGVVVPIRDAVRRRGLSSWNYTYEAIFLWPCMAAKAISICPQRSGMYILQAPDYEHQNLPWHL
eukprot:84478-Pyramimonas_sp.AAC.1